MTLATRRDYRVSMPYVKLDVGILDSTLWPDTTARSVFITALLMAQPREFSEPQKEIDLHSTRETGYEVPAGWYGYVAASGMGICNRALVDWDSNDPENYETGRCALAVLCGKDPDSRSNEFEGRRMLRVNGGYLVLNFMKYRDKDHTSADRSRRWRDRQRDTALRNGETRSETVERVRSLRVTHSESDPKAEASEKNTEGASASPREIEYPSAFSLLWESTGRRGVKAKAFKAWKAVGKPDWTVVKAPWLAYMASERPAAGFVQDLSTWLNGRGWQQEWPMAAPKTTGNGKPAWRNDLAAQGAREAQASARYHAQQAQEPTVCPWHFYRGEDGYASENCNKRCPSYGKDLHGNQIAVR